MGFLTGKSKSTSTQSNKAYDDIHDSFAPLMGNAGQSTDFIKTLLGLGGDSSAQQGALNNYADSTGMNFVMDQGSRAITGNKAASGLLQSGSTLKALDKFGQGVGSTYLNDYLSNLFKVADTGFNSGTLLAQAGQTASSKSKSKPGLGGAIGSIASAIPMI